LGTHGLNIIEFLEVDARGKGIGEGTGGEEADDEF
jgi:hypothetical protein